MLAHNTKRSGDGSVPVIIEWPEMYPFGKSDPREDWHEASDEEYAAYVKYWNEVDRDEHRDINEKCGAR